MTLGSFDTAIMPDSSEMTSCRNYFSRDGLANYRIT